MWKITRQMKLSIPWVQISKYPKLKKKNKQWVLGIDNFRNREESGMWWLAHSRWNLLVLYVGGK